MKKNLKKIITLLVSVMMMLAIAAVANAAETAPETYKITIKSKQGVGNPALNEYTAYKIADLKIVDVEEEDLGSSFEIERVYSEAFPGVSEVASVNAFENWIEQEKRHVSGIKTRNDLARALAGAVSDNVESYVSVPAENGTDAEINGLGVGYYLIVETDHGSDDVAIQTNYILTTVSENTTISLKTSQPSVEKKIVWEKDNKTLVDDNVVAVGDTIEYQLKAQIPVYSDDVKTNSLVFTLTDTMSDGLTFQRIETVKISGTNTGDLKLDDATAVSLTNGLLNGYTITPSVNSFTLSLGTDVIKNYGGKYLYVSFTAMLNDAANVGETGNPNSVNLTYTNTWDAQGNGKTGKTPDDTVISYTGELMIEKVDGNDNSVKLESVQFKITKENDTDAEGLRFIQQSNGSYLYKKDGSATDSTDTLVTNENGLITIYGLDAGTYYAVETETIGNYTLDNNPKEIKLTVASDAEYEGKELETKGDVVSKHGNDDALAYTVNWTVEGANEAGHLEIVNTKGLILPGTGGIGTTLFTFGGLALVVLAAVMFIVYTRKQKKDA